MADGALTPPSHGSTGDHAQSPGLAGLTAAGHASHLSAQHSHPDSHYSLHAHSAAGHDAGRGASVFASSSQPSHLSAATSSGQAVPQQFYPGASEPQLGRTSSYSSYMHGHAIGAGAAHAASDHGPSDLQYMPPSRAPQNPPPARGMRQSRSNGTLGAAAAILGMSEALGGVAGEENHQQPSAGRAEGGRGGALRPGLLVGDLGARLGMRSDNAAGRLAQADLATARAIDEQNAEGGSGDAMAGAGGRGDAADGSRSAGGGRRKSRGASGGAKSGSGGNKATGKKRRFLWDDLLHRRFVGAIFDFGTRHATPKALFQLMQPAPSHMTSDHIKSHLQKYRANYGRSRDAFLLEYERALREARARAREIEVRTGVTPFPPGFSTFPLQMPAHLQSGAPPPHNASGELPEWTRKQLEQSRSGPNEMDYGVQAILQGGAKKGAVSGLKPLTAEDEAGLHRVEGTTYGSLSSVSPSSSASGEAGGGKRAHGRNRRAQAGGSSGGRGSAGSAGGSSSGKGSIGVGGPTVLEAFGQSELRAPAMSALAMHTADVHARALHDPGLPLADAWRAIREGMGPAEMAVGAVSKALEDFLKASNDSSGQGLDAATAAASSARAAAAFAQQKVHSLLEGLANAADDLEEATRRAVAQQLPGDAVGPFPPHLYCDPLRAARLMADSDAADVVPRLDAQVLAAVYGNGDGAELPGLNEAKDSMLDALGELPRSELNDARAMPESARSNAIAWGASGTAIRDDIESGEQAAAMGAMAVTAEAADRRAAPHALSLAHA